MKKFAVVAVIPLVTGFLYAQSQSTQTTETKTTTTTWNGTLVDANCYTTHTEHKETTSNSANRETTTTTTETNTECPVTTTTTSFGLLTPTGQYVHFDQPSNTRIVEVVKGNKKWTKYLEGRQPLKVTVIGEPSGEVVVMRSIK
jgi:uncharacterized surface protein with fasciclin (FAS1) repeats